MHTYIHTCIHAYIHTCIHAYIHTYLHTYFLTFLLSYLLYIHTMPYLTFTFTLHYITVHYITLHSYICIYTCYIWVYFFRIWAQDDGLLRSILVWTFPFQTYPILTNNHALMGNMLGWFRENPWWKPMLVPWNMGCPAVLFPWPNPMWLYLHCSSCLPPQTWRVYHRQACLFASFRFSNVCLVPFSCMYVNRTRILFFAL